MILKAPSWQLPVICVNIWRFSGLLTIKPAEVSGKRKKNYFMNLDNDKIHLYY